MSDCRGNQWKKIGFEGCLDYGSMLCELAQGRIRGSKHHSLVVSMLLHRGIAGHCSAIDNNTIYIFGNVGRGSKATAKFLTIDFAVSKSKG